MEYSEIKKIMKDMEESSLAELSIEFPDGTKVSLKNEAKGSITKAEEIPQNVIVDEPTKDEMKVKEEIEDKKIIKSPMVGTFYAKSSPNAAPYVEVGKHVKKGDILCIIEAMKLMNEIESEYDGEISEILVNDGEMVDYGKPLFRIR